MTKDKVDFANLPAEQLIRVLDFLEGDGHIIWRDAPLRKLLPDEYVDAVSVTHKSDGTHKGSIYPPGVVGIPGQQVLPETTGVYGLSLYRRIARDLGVPPSEMSGRGYEARDLDYRIREHLHDAEAEKQDA